MTQVDTQEYRQLAIESSNGSIRYDCQWILGEYAQYAWHALCAGMARMKMGEIKSGEGDFTQAAADWLFASRCFCLIGRPQLADWRSKTCRKNLEWAMKFSAGSDRVAVLKVCDLYLSGDAKLAAEIGRALLHPNCNKPLRYLVGLAHVSSNPESLLERERA